MTDSFHFLSMVLENESFSFPHVQNKIVDHISLLISKFDRYNPENTMKYTWARIPLINEPQDLSEDITNINK